MTKSYLKKKKAQFRENKGQNYSLEYTINKDSFKNLQKCLMYSEKPDLSLQQHAN